MDNKNRLAGLFGKLTNGRFSTLFTVLGGVYRSFISNKNYIPYLVGK
jgi:hypothetical protein